VYTGTDTKYYFITSGLATGWNFVKIAKSAFGTTGTGAWSGIQSLVALWRSNDGYTDEYVSFCYLQLVRKDPSTAAPNPFQIAGARDLTISSGEWYVGMEYDVLVWKLLYNASSNPFRLLGQQSYTDYIATGKIKGSHATTRGYVTWYVSATNYITALVLSDTLTLRLVEDSVTTNYQLSMAINANDEIEFKLYKIGTSIILIAFLNGDIDTPYQVNATTTISSAGYLCVGGLETGTYGMAYYQGFSITTTEHSHTASIADTAKSVMFKYKAGAFTAAELNPGEFGIDTTNNRIYYLESASQIRYLSGT
jgi:hypothetical protein